MPAADVPPNQPESELTEATHSPTVPETEHPSEPEWQTVDFPDAMSVDQLPVVDSDHRQQPSSTAPQTQSTPSFLEIAPQVESETGQNVESENSTEFIQALHECNQDLIEQIAELETELDACQKTLRDQEVVLNQQTQELALAQEQVTRLFGKQELSNQVIQRQQVLVETLTQQWETSQTKMAEMERDCALTQQRYNEQFHELMQTQNTCRDLRSRLHRQQRHTLQFKAALERCLEMQPRWGQHRSQEILNQPQLIIDSPSAAEVESKPLTPDETEQTPSTTTPKASPVLPWSLQGMVEDESIAPLEEMIQGQVENPFSTQPSEIIDQTPDPEVESTSSPELEALESYWHVELPLHTPPSEPQDISFTREEIPQAELIDQELERIQAEYESLSQDHQDELELERLESFPKSLSEEEAESALINEPSQPQSIPQQTTVDNLPSSWPAPLIRPQRRRKLESLASIELPKLPKTPHWTPESESLSIQEWAEMEPF